MLRRLLALPLVLAIAAPQDALADVNRCAEAETDLAYAGTDFVELSGDTGWFPSWSVAQLRLVGRVAGHTNVAAGYAARGCWTEQMQASLAGRQATGYFDVAYGAELALYGRIHTTVLGQTINWEGQIPIPWIPDDLLIGATTKFDPALDRSGVTITDQTAPVTVLSTDLLASVISLGGISGGLYVTVTGGMSTTYRANKTTLVTTAVDAASDLVSVARPGTGFHSTLSLPVAVDGTVRYAPTLTFTAGLDLRIFGIRVVDWQLYSIPMTLPGIDRPVKLEGMPAVLELPEAHGIGEGARMDFATASTQSLRIKNTGQGTLELVPFAVPVGITIAPMTLAPGAEADLRVTVDDGALAGGSTTIDIKTNDPDLPTVALALGMDVGGTDPGEPPVFEDGEPGGCSTGTGHGGALVVFVLGFVVVLRRRA